MTVSSEPLTPASPASGPARAESEGTRPIRFIHRGAVRHVDGLAPTLSVLEWLRTQARCTGTKEGCAEGDCGACTVIVAELVEAPADPGETASAPELLLRPINACIRFLPTLDGKALLTVEDLAGSALHPAQQALVDSHGSQCGFCTPGFTMTLTACYEHHQQAGTRPTREELAHDLAGNLCRCTGYRPILDAGQRMFEAPVKRLDRAALTAQLMTLRHDPPLHAVGPDADGSGRTQHFHAPRSVQALAALKAAQPDARLLAGCTDIGLWVNKQFRPLGDIVYLGEVPALRRLQTLPDGSLHIGAAVTLEDAWQALLVPYPELQELWLRFAGPPVRHAGTLVGNLANGSPIGDGAPALMALGASLHVRHGERQRTLALEDFYVDYQKNRLEPGEWIEAVTVPPRVPGLQLRGWKISKRHDSDISSLCAVFALRLQGEAVTQARLVFGGMAGIVKRATQSEAALTGQAWNEATLAAAQQALPQDFQPLTDLRASAAYRMATARGLLQRLWLQTRPALDGQPALTAEATQVRVHGPHATA